MKNPDFHNNIDLVFALKMGDERAYMFLVDQYHANLLAYAISLINDFSMAQDIIQIVFLRTWQFRNKLDDQFSIKSFLYKSVYNEFVNTYQKNKSMLLLQKNYIESLNEIVEEIDDSDMESLVKLVMKEISNLPKKCQLVFVMSKKEGFSNIEIAEYLGVSIKTVEAQITKGYSLLRKKLGGKFATILFLVFGENIGYTN